MAITRDVNFGFFQKSIIVLKKSIFFDYRIWVSLAISLCRGLLRNVPRARRCWCSHVGGRSL